MNNSHETDGRIYLYFRFDNRYFNQDGKTVTKSRQRKRVFGIGSFLQPSLCAESAFQLGLFILQYRPVVTEVDQGTVVTRSSALLRCRRAEKLKSFFHLRHTYSRNLQDKRRLFTTSEYSCNQAEGKCCCSRKMRCHGIRTGVHA